MKSGVQLNFIERRVRADRALSQLVRMARETTETLSSREQRGLYRLESKLIETSNMAPPAAHVWMRSAFAARWKAFSIIVLTLVRSLWARVCVDAQSALFRARPAWGPHLARIFIALRVSVARGGAELRKLRGRERAQHEP